MDLNNVRFIVRKEFDVWNVKKIIDEEHEMKFPYGQWSSFEKAKKHAGELNEAANKDEHERLVKQQVEEMNNILLKRDSNSKMLL